MDFLKGLINNLMRDRKIVFQSNNGAMQHLFPFMLQFLTYWFSP